MQLQFLLCFLFSFIFLLFYFFGTQVDILLTLYSGITPCSVWGTKGDAEDQTQISYMHGKHLTSWIITLALCIVFFYQSLSTISFGTISNSWNKTNVICYGASIRNLISFSLNFLGMENLGCIHQWWGTIPGSVLRIPWVSLENLLYLVLEIINVIGEMRSKC